MKTGAKCKWLAGILTAGMISTVCMMPAMAAEELEAPESAGWSKTVETKATWDKVEDATGYQIRLYYNHEYLQTIHADTTKEDLAEYMTREGWYYYEVRAVAENKSGVKYMDSSEYTVSDEQIIENLGDTEGRWKNYVDGKKYEKEDGTIVTAQWYLILGKWYYFDANGHMVIGWLKDGNTWYYMDADGIMQTGWLQDGDLWYYLDANGAMVTGWYMANPGQWYYLRADGSMAANTTVDGYYVNASGVWVP